jgi:hypothetical protein
MAMIRTDRLLNGYDLDGSFVKYEMMNYDTMKIDMNIYVRRTVSKAHTLPYST